MSALKEYSIIGTKFTGRIVFKYDLNGVLREFSLVECGEMSEKQINWLFSRHFPYYENQIGNFRSIKTFTVFTGEFKVDFEDFWKAYRFKIAKVETEKAWKKLTDDEKIKAIDGIRSYDQYLFRNRGIKKARGHKYLNQRFFDDEWASVH